MHGTGFEDSFELQSANYYLPVPLARDNSLPLPGEEAYGLPSYTSLRFLLKAKRSKETRRQKTVNLLDTKDVNPFLTFLSTSQQQALFLPQFPPSY